MKKISIKKNIFLFTNNSSFINSHRIELINELKKNFNITIVANFDEKILIKDIAKINLSLSFSNNIINLFKIIYLYKNIIKKNKIDVIHSIGVKTNLLILFSSLFQDNKKIIFHFTGMGNLFTLKKFFLLKYIVSLCFIAFDKHNFNYIFQKKEDLKKINLFNSIKSKKVFLIHGSGVDTNKFKKKTIFNKKNINILMSSRMIQGKGIESYFEIVDKFKNNTNFKFYFAGKNNVSGIPFNLTYYEHLVKKNKNFIFLHNIKNMNKLLEKIDIVVYPSNYGEGIPRFLLESLSCGIPIICSDIDAHYYLVDNKKNGSLIKKNNIDEYISQILYFSDVDRRKKVSIYSRTKCLKKFDIKTILKEHLNVYNFIINKTK